MRVLTDKELIGYLKSIIGVCEVTIENLGGRNMRVWKRENHPRDDRLAKQAAETHQIE